MTEITFSISDELFEKMKKYPEIKWDSIARAAVENYIEKLELVDKITSKSTFTLEDAETIGDEIKRKMWEMHKIYLDNVSE